MGQRVRCGFKSIAKKPGGADVLSVNLSLLDSRRISHRNAVLQNVSVSVR